MMKSPSPSETAAATILAIIAAIIFVLSIIENT